MCVVIAGSESPSPTWAEAAPEDKSIFRKMSTLVVYFYLPGFSAGIITAIVVPVTLVVIVVLVSFIYVCIYRDIKGYRYNYRTIDQKRCFFPS